MFDAQTAGLIRQAPPLEGVDPALLPQELTDIYAELAGIRLRAATFDTDSEYQGRLERVERIATVYEALVDNGAEGDERRAAAFVAGTAYQVLGRITTPTREREELLTTQAIDPRVSAPLLFLIAEQSPDAREAARSLSGPRLEDIHRSALIESIEDLALEHFEAILERADRLASLGPSADAPFQERATQALYGLCWSGLVQLVSGLLERDIPALAFQQFDTPQAAFDRVVGVSTRTIDLPDASAPTIISSYAGPRHLARLLRNVADMLGGAGITRVPPPAGADTGLWRRWIRHRAATKPVLWPNHRAAIATGLLDVGTSAVLVLPTGAGKTTLSELKIAATLSAGKKIIFLVPTLALVDQLRDDLAESFPKTLSTGEVATDGDLTALLAEPELQKIEVMTPERCLALMSFAPADLSELGLFVFDECHLLSSSGGGSRSVDAMLCLLHAMKRAPEADLLLLSAMLQNAQEVADWLESATGRRCVGFHDPWKPSRQARGVVVYPKEQVRAADAIVGKKKRAQARKLKYDAPPLLVEPFALFGLQHAWIKSSPTDRRLVRLSDERVELAHGTSIATPNANQVAAILSGHAATARLKTIVFVQQADHAPTTAGKLKGKLPAPAALKETENGMWQDIVAELGDETCSLVDPTAPAIVHNGDMIALERRLAESIFRRSDGADIIVATPTLAQGMNLPAQVAILAGTMRHDDDKGRMPLQSHEVLNAAGRAGRAGYLANGTVLLIPEPVASFDGLKPEDSAFDMLRKVLPPNDQCVRIEDPLTTLLDAVQAGDVSDARVRYFLSRLRAGSDEATAIEDGLTMMRHSFAAYQARKMAEEQSFNAKLDRLKAALEGEAADANAGVMKVAAFTGLAVEPLVSLAERVQAEIDSLPTTVCGWIEWLIDFCTIDRSSYHLLFGAAAVDTVKAITRGKKKGGDSSVEEMARLKGGLRLWLQGAAYKEIEQAFGVAPKKVGVCKRTRDLANQIANRQLYIVAAAAAEVIKQVLAAAGKTSANPAVLEILPVAVRKGLDDPEKVAFAYQTPGARSRVLIHRSYAERIGDRAPILGSDYAHVMHSMEVILAFSQTGLS